MDISMANTQVNQQTQIQRQTQSQRQNLYTVLADLQSNHRRYLQVMDDALEIIREQRPMRGGFRSSLSGYRESTTATATTTAGTAAGTTAGTTAGNDTLSFEFVSVMNPATILAMMRDASGSDLLGFNQNQVGPVQDISNNTTVYQQPELPEPAICPITLEPIEVGTNVMKITRCGHVFKEAPLRRWLLRDGRCPVCRGSLS